MQPDAVTSTEKPTAPSRWELRALTAHARQIGRGDVHSWELDLQCYRVSSTRVEFTADGKVHTLVLVDKQDNRNLGRFKFKHPTNVHAGETVTLEGDFGLEAFPMPKPEPKPIPTAYSGAVKLVVMTTTDEETGQMQLWVDPAKMRAWVTEKPLTRHVGTHVLLEPFNPATPHRRTLEQPTRSNGELY